MGLKFSPLTQEHHITIHSVHWAIKPPQPSPFFLAKPPALNLQTIRTLPFLGNFPYIFVFREPLFENLVGSSTPPAERGGGVGGVNTESKEGIDKMKQLLK